MSSAWLGLMVVVLLGPGMVDSDLLDLFGDKWDCGLVRCLGFGALRGKPAERDEKEKEDKGSSNTNPKNHPQFEAKD